MQVLLRTFGCRANQYDSEQVRALCERAGIEVVESGDADIAVLNSCAVTREAEADLRQAVRRIARERPGTRVVVTGCAAARSALEIAALPGVTDVIAGADLAAVAAALHLRAPMPTSESGADQAPSAFTVLTRASRQSTARATLRVQDGCDEHCTFCATTLARGAHRSRSAKEIVAEASLLAAHHAEIVLTGVHVGSWGREHGRSIGALVTALVRDVPTVRFRLASIEATEVDAELAEWLRDGGRRVCPYLHAPLQSGSDAVLKRMGRHWYTAREYARAIDRLTAGRAVFGLGADIMAGFPGETDADQAETVALIRELPFTHLHVFPYSPRPGTAAERLGQPVPPPVARARAAELRAIGADKSAAYAASRVGGRADLVVIGPAVGPVRGPALRKALTEDYLEVRLIGDFPRGSRLHATIEDGAMAVVTTALTTTAPTLTAHH